ncbi:ATP-dependent helicase [Synechococcus sp. Nb3U1]|uniref:ATP-dependent helicase n=1 Tax=Synechococcus sp. Nb3U1 TaxID=1914529 RepID=UPI001F1FEC67|nr:ATP-dependent helicase [Synechococcus sp. Nb3U1]MCF2972288.1 ATP-dependent helicase [Synechococcus sp. Nb3U1]
MVGLASPPFPQPILRPAQQQALAYQSGALGIAAVPGSGKTFILELLISDLILNRGIPPERIGVFTYMRSARGNLISRINQRLQQAGYLNRFTQAFTLHSLSLRVLREAPGEELSILEQYERDRLLSRLCRAWLTHHTQFWDPLIPTDDNPQKVAQNRARFRQSFQQMVQAVISTAKNLRLAPGGIPSDTQGYLAWAAPIYASYQAELQRLGKLDYDDLGWQAVELIDRSPEVRAQVQDWYDYLFEDEAQDSSPLQEDLLRLLSQRTGNLIRVGDPNQSIMGTFTTAEPRLFRAFCRASPQVILQESSRSAPQILALANRLVDWVNREHPLTPLRTALAPQHIQLASSGGQNPPASEGQVEFQSIRGSPDEELQQVVLQAIQATQAFPEHTVVILVTTNEMGGKALSYLQEMGAERVVDLLRNNPSQRRVLLQLKGVIDLFAVPTAPMRLAAAVEYLADWAGIPRADLEPMLNWIRASLPERLLFPYFGEDPSLPYGPKLATLLRTLAGWLRAGRSPWTEVLNLVIQSLYRKPEELFVGRYVIDQLEQVLGSLPETDWQEIAQEFQVILDHRLNNLPSEILAFNPEPGSITVTTLHRSKGLEWDQVFIPQLSAYEFPTHYRDRRFGLAFLEDVDMQAEALAQLRQLNPKGSWELQADSATEQAFLDLAAERLRLLYVGITRSKRRLTLSVSSQSRFGSEQSSSLLFRVLNPKPTAG